MDGLADYGPGGKPKSGFGDTTFVDKEGFSMRRQLSVVINTFYIHPVTQEHTIARLR